MRRIGLLPRLIIGLVSGIVIGYLCSLAGVEWPVRLLATFNSLFGGFLNYIIPFIILGYVAYGIADLQKDAGKLLLLTVIIAYVSTVIAGLFAFGGATLLLPGLAGDRSADNPEHALLTAFFTVEMPPLMGVMTALITAFVLGVGMAAIRSQTMLSFMKEFEAIISKVIHNIIIPLLPIHIGGIFANMTFSGQVWNTMVVFGQVFAVIIGMHLIYIMAQFVVASGIAGRNPVRALRNMLPAYVTAVGTQSSAATIPVTLRCAKKNVSEDVADFVIPLCATIHLSGSTITVTTCAMAIMYMSGMTASFDQIMPFILMLGITMVAAPGVPGGAIMAALGLLSSMLGFSEAQLALMIALYLTQDSFGTATNVTGDGAIAIIIDWFAKRKVAATGGELAMPPTSAE
jgi:Na+/H+-dicarboxylate symporter